MKNFGLLTIIFLLWGCSTVPITNRKQLALVSEYQMVQSSSLAYNEFLSQNEVVNLYDERTMMVKRVGEKLAEGCEKFLKDHGDPSRTATFQWEFNLVESDQINAWCMPGGKVVVYTGILPVTQSEEGLATVLSHEIAHAIARHSNERVSQQIMTQVGGSVLSTVLLDTELAAYNIDAIILNVYGLGANLGLLKFSRNQETEADKMGLVFMEYAGYDCSTAIDFWKRMSAAGNAGVPEILSTHPTDDRRIQEIEMFIPVAKSYIY